MSLTLEEANRTIRSALAKAHELNIKISAAVCDAGGRPLAFQRRTAPSGRAPMPARARRWRRRRSDGRVAKWRSVPISRRHAASPWPRVAI